MRRDFDCLKGIQKLGMNDSIINQNFVQIPRVCYLLQKLFGGFLPFFLVYIFCDLGSGHMELQVCHIVANYLVFIQNILDKIGSCK